MTKPRDAALRSLEEAFFYATVLLCAVLSVGLEARALIAGYRPDIGAVSVALYVAVAFVVSRLALRAHRSPGWRPWNGRRTMRSVEAPEDLRAAVQRRLENAGIKRTVTVRLIRGVLKADAFVIWGADGYELWVTAGLWASRIYRPMAFDAVIDHEAAHILAGDPRRYVFLKSILATTGIWILARAVVIAVAPGFLTAAGYARMLPMPTRIGTPDVARIADVAGGSVFLPSPQYMVAYGSTPELTNVIFFLVLVHVLSVAAIAICYVGFIRMKEHAADLVAQHAVGPSASTTTFHLGEILGAERPSFWHPRREARIAVAAGTRSAVPYVLLGALLGLGSASLRIVLGASSLPGALNLPGSVAVPTGILVLIVAGFFVSYALDGSVASRARPIGLLVASALVTSSIVFAGYLVPWLSFDLLGERTTGITSLRAIELLDATIMYGSLPLWVLLCCGFHVFAIRRGKLVASRRVVSVIILLVIAGPGLAYMRFARGMYAKSQCQKLLANPKPPPVDPGVLVTDPAGKDGVEFVDFPSHLGNTRTVILLTSCRFLEIASDPPLFFRFDAPSFVMWLPPRKPGLEGEADDLMSFLSAHATGSPEEECAHYLRDAGYR